MVNIVALPSEDMRGNQCNLEKCVWRQGMV